MMYFVFSILVIKIVFGAQLINCPRNQLKFEKIIGLRPSDTIQGYLLHKHQNYESVTTECLSKCLSKDDCLSFVIYYNISECYWYNNQLEGIEENDNIIDSEVGWFSKTCLNAGNCNKSWVFERIPGAILIGNDIKTLPNKITRSECQQYCLDETVVPCRAVKFRIHDEPNSTETKGICILSDTDRHLMPNSYRVSSYNEEYFENQCSNVTTNEFCAYEEYDNVILSHVDFKYDSKMKTECEEICETVTMFNCRGYSLIPTGTIVTRNSKIENTYTCLIHSEDSKVHGPGSLQNINGAKYHEKAKCINITVTCTDAYINIMYQPDTNFMGKIYMSGYSEHLECYTTGKGKEMIQLKIPLFENQCGLHEARSANYINRTLISGTMILQYNPLIQTQGDRLIRVGCIFTNESKVVLGTGLNFTSSTYPNGSTVIINSSTAHPVIEMRVVDYYTQQEVSDTQIGQELQLIIEIKPADGPYDIWAGHLIAMTDDGQDSIILLDDRGCPTNPNIFSTLTKIQSNDTRKLVGNFQAFKFTSSPVIRFSVIVQFCTNECVPADCEHDTGKRKRDILSQIIETINGTTVTQLNKNEFDNEGKKSIQMPLEFVMIVRNAKTVPDRLVFGENKKILIAGYDLVTNEVCIDYSLLIGIIITWTLAQVILVTCCILMVKRYKSYYQDENTTQSLEELHKNFGLGFSNLEPRHVRWADNRDYS